MLAGVDRRPSDVVHRILDACRPLESAVIRPVLNLVLLVTPSRATYLGRQCAGDAGEPVSTVLALAEDLRAGVLPRGSLRHVTQGVDVNTDLLLLHHGRWSDRSRTRGHVRLGLAGVIRQHVGAVMCVREVPRNDTVPFVVLNRLNTDRDRVLACLQALVDTGGANVLADKDLLRGLGAVLVVVRLDGERLHSDRCLNRGCGCDNWGWSFADGCRGSYRVR